jgi:hypothetical protein
VTLRGLAAAFIAGVVAFTTPRIASADPMADRQFICRTIFDAAQYNGLPPGFLARLLWTESGFSSAATSSAGALGVAQFMPQTAAERGLANPRDPFQAIYHAARLLAELQRQFGNLGLAAAAYNSGGIRLAKWLQGVSPLPLETRLYVMAVTGRPPEDWAALRTSLYAMTASYPLPGLDCLNAETKVAHHDWRMKSPSPAPAWVARLDNGLASAVAFFDRLPGLEAAPPKPVSRGQLRDADSLCTVIRAEGARCQVFAH